MVAELQQRPAIENDQPGQGDQAGNSWSPGLEDYEAYGRQDNSKNGNSRNGKAEFSENDLICTPIEGFDTKPGKPRNAISDRTYNESSQTGDSKSEDPKSKDSKAKDSKVGETLRGSDIVQTPNTNETLRTPEHSQDPNTSEILRTSEHPEDPNTSETLKTSELPQDPKSSDTFRISEHPEDPEAAEESATGEIQGKVDEKQKSSDQPAPQIEAGKDIALDPETQKAKNDFVKIFEDRFKDDPRVKDDPNLLPALRERMAQMDQRILHERIKTDDGSYINQQEQLAKEYRNLAVIGTQAEKLTDDSGHQVFSEPWMVNNILASGIIRAAQPIPSGDQGANNTCAAESINRGGMKAVAGVDSESIAQMCKNGGFDAVDNASKPFICRVHKASLALDAEAEAIHLNRSNARDAWGQLSDIRTAQLNLDLQAREEFGAGAEGRFVYSKVSPISQRNTGERVVDTKTGRTIAEDPCFFPETESNTAQSLYGCISKTYGKDTTVVAANPTNGDNVTGVTDSSNLKAHLKYLGSRGLLAMVNTEVAYYVNNSQGLGGARGRHVTSAQIGKEGGIDFINNWGGKHDYKNLSAEALFCLDGKAHHVQL